MRSNISAFILGLLINMYLLNKYGKDYLVVSLYWQWILLIYLFDSIIKSSKYKKNTLNTIGTLGTSFTVMIYLSLFMQVLYSLLIKPIIT